MWTALQLVAAAALAALVHLARVMRRFRLHDEDEPRPPLGDDVVVRR